MLNRSSPSIHRNDPRPKPQTNDLTIHGGSFIADNRRQTRVHNDNSETINNSHNRTAFNAPVQGYVHSAKNGGALNGFVQITNVHHPVDGLSDTGSRSPKVPNPSPIAHVSSLDGAADHPISQTRSQQTADGKGGDNIFSAPAVPDPNRNPNLQQELSNLSPDMQAFVTSLQRNAQRREKANANGIARNHTL